MQSEPILDTPSFPRKQYGAVSPAVLGAVLIVVLILLIGGFILWKSRSSQVPALAGGDTNTAAVQEASAPPPPANVGAMGTDELLAQAKQAMNSRRIIAPAGNNAFEFYLKVLEKDPSNRVATNALRETFPFAASAVEQDINAEKFEEAAREIDLLSKADPTNYTLTILRSKLDAQQTLAQRAEEQAKLAEQQQLLAEQQAQQAREAAAQAAAAASAQAAAAAAAAERQENQREQAANTTQAAPEVVEAAPEPEPVGPTRGAILVETVQPTYPAVALRRRVQGWVDVRFTVTATGEVTNAVVVGTSRGKTFNRAALDAVRQWKFQPALDNGQPVSSIVEQRIRFNL